MLISKTIAAALLAAGFLSTGSASLAAGQAVRGVHPVLMAEMPDAGLLVGGMLDGKWCNPRATAPRINGGERYKLYSTSGYVSTVIGKKPMNEGSNHFLVEISGAKADYAIGIAGDWNAIPRKICKDRTDRKIYVDAVRKLLCGNGLPDAPVNITDARCVDLDGDGKREMLLVAQSASFNRYVWKKGDYSLVVLLASGDEPRTYLLKGEFHRKDREDEWPESYGFSGSWDVDGDGMMEIGVGFSNVRADVGGILFYDWNGVRPRLLAEAGMGH